MFSTCANPDCATPFEYHRGEFFRFHNDHMDEAPDRQSHSVQHFWLCECCCEKYTLHYTKNTEAFSSAFVPQRFVPEERLA